MKSIFVCIIMYLLTSCQSKFASDLPIRYEGQVNPAGTRIYRCVKGDCARNFIILYEDYVFARGDYDVSHINSKNGVSTYRFNDFDTTYVYNNLVRWGLYRESGDSLIVYRFAPTQGSWHNVDSYLYLFRNDSLFFEVSWHPGNESIEYSKKSKIHKVELGSIYEQVNVERFPSHKRAFFWKQYPWIVEKK